MRGWVFALILSAIWWPAGGGLGVGPEVSNVRISPGSIQGHRAVHLGTTLVNTFVTVTDKRGRLISDLKASDFVVWDNGVRQRITEFSRETQLPLTLALVIDRSRSVQARFELERMAAINFLKSILRRGQDRGLLVAFDSDVYLISDFTDDAVALTRKIRNLSVAGNSAVFDAVYKTARYKFGPISFGRKVLVLITDGDDTASEATLSEAIDMALRTDVIVYPIGIRGTKAGIAALKRLAEATGGRALFLDEEHTRLAELFDQLEMELRNQYSIGYEVKHVPDGRFHRLKIRVKKRGLTVRARKGYYALPLPAKGGSPSTQ